MDTLAEAVLAAMLLMPLLHFVIVSNSIHRRVQRSDQLVSSTHIRCHNGTTDGLQPVGMENEFSLPSMPSTTPCVNCGIVGNVRWERVLTGTVIFVEYYCRRCDHVWRVDNDERLSTPATTPKEKPERSRAMALPDNPRPAIRRGDRPRTDRWR